MPYICYIDEARCSAPLPAKKTDIQPLLVIAGLIVRQEALPLITREFLALKRKYFPGSFTSPHLLDDVREEIKGSELRSAVRKKGHKAGTQLRFIDDTLELLDRSSPLPRSHHTARSPRDRWILAPIGRLY